MPTVLQRQGVFTEPVAGRVPSIFDPATSTTVGGVTTRTPFPNGTIPSGRIDPVAAGLLDHYPLPTSAGTANNYRRQDEETVDQDQFDVRVDHHFGSGRDHLFARTSHFGEAFDPVTPLPDGSGVTTGTLGFQRTSAWSVATSYQRLSGPPGQRAPNRRHAAIGPARRRDLARQPLGGPRPARDPVVRQLPRHPADLRGRGLPAARLAAQHGHGLLDGVTQIDDALVRSSGRHTVKIGADLRWSRLDVIQPPSPTGAFQFTTLFTDQPGVANTGNPFASFLLGQVQTFSIDLQEAASATARACRNTSPRTTGVSAIGGR